MDVTGNGQSRQRINEMGSDTLAANIVGENGNRYWICYDKLFQSVLAYSFSAIRFNSFLPARFVEPFCRKYAIRCEIHINREFERKPNMADQNLFIGKRIKL